MPRKFKIQIIEIFISLNHTKSDVTQNWIIYNGVFMVVKYICGLNYDNEDE